MTNLALLGAKQALLMTNGNRICVQQPNSVVVEQHDYAGRVPGWS